MQRWMRPDFWRSRATSNLKGITTFGKIAATRSMPACRFPEKQIFRLACRLFTDASVELEHGDGCDESGLVLETSVTSLPTDMAGEVRLPCVQ